MCLAIPWLGAVSTWSLHQLPGLNRLLLLGYIQMSLQEMEAMNPFCPRFVYTSIVFSFHQVQVIIVVRNPENLIKFFPINCLQSLCNKARMQQ